MFLGIYPKATRTRRFVRYKRIDTLSCYYPLIQPPAILVRPLWEIVKFLLAVRFFRANFLPNRESALEVELQEFPIQCF